MMPSAQSLRGYECAGRKRTFTKPGPMGGWDQGSLRRTYKHLLSFSVSANGVPKRPRESTALQHYKVYIFFQDRRNEVAPLAGPRRDDGKT
jgi:hypothetical protein